MKSLRARLLSLLGLAILVASAVQFGASFSAAMAQANRLFDAQMRQIAEYARVTHGAIGDADSDIRTDFDMVVQVWHAGQLRIYQERQHRMLPHRAPVGYSIARLENGDWRVYAAPFDGGMVQVAQKMAARRDAAISLALHTLWPIALVAAALMIAMGYVVGWALRPLAHAGAELTARDARSLEPVRFGRVPSELEPIRDALNALLERVAEVIELQRQFVSHAAHELRSPLTVLKMQLQLLTRARAEADRIAAATALDRAIGRSSRMVEQLLALAREDAIAQAADSHEPSDLVAGATDAIAEVAGFAADKEVALSFLEAAPCKVAVDADSLRILLRNLLDNAVRYTPPQGAVSVGVETVRGQAVLTVADSGPGIPEADLARVTERFYRVPGTGESGSGLGLAIAAAIVARAGAELQLRNSATGGLVVKVLFGAG